VSLDKEREGWTARARSNIPSSRFAHSDDGDNFVSSDITSPVWGHEPTAARAPIGEYVVFFTANFDEIPCSGVECMNRDNGNSVVDEGTCLPDTQCISYPDLLTSRIPQVHGQSRS